MKNDEFIRWLMVHDIVFVIITAVTFCITKSPWSFLFLIFVVCSWGSKKGNDEK